MISRDDLIHYLNDYLKIDEFSDYGPQGLQVEGKSEVQTIVTGVSASVQLFEKAVQAGADMIIVHHGILWDRDSHVIKGGFKNRIKLLLENDITLLCYHLPLDKHAEIGNNAVIAKKLGLSNLEEFGDVGIQGQIKETELQSLLKTIQDTIKSDPLVFAYGPEKISKIAICSGSAQKEITIAIENGADVFITGEVSEPTMHIAKEGNIHFIAAGHYATETFGIKALGDHIEKKYNLPVKFIDVPNPV